MSAREKGILTKDSVSLLPCFYFVELPILVSSVVSLYFLEWTDVFKPVKSGFNCHDRSLSLPYIDPNHEVIPLLMLLSLAFAGPAITIMIGEAILFCCLSRRKSGAGAEANINAAGCNFNSFIRRAVRFVGVHAFGLCATALITDILQLMTGYPTPYFLTVCKPNYTTLNVSCEQNPYVMEDICSGANPAAINQGRKSFPSQHATLASFAAIYVSMYFNSTLTDSSKLLKPLLVFSFIICAIICGLTRIIQYKNHAIDVYLGFLLGGAIAVYLGLYAVGNFQPSEEASTSPPPLIHRPPCSLPHISQEAVLHHLQMKASMTGEPGIPTSHPEGLLHRGLQQQRPDESLKRSSADVEVISPRSPQSKDAMVTFSHTLPRVHTPQAMAAFEEAARRHAATLHHASLDSSRSKQLLSQWKSKNNNHKCSLQVPDSFSSSVDSSSGQSSQHPHHHGSMELRSSSEPSAMGLNGGFDGHAYMSKLPTGASTTLPSNCSGITGGARIAMQSRPGSSQLVHIPEEVHENFNTPSPRMGGGSEEMSTLNSTAQANWQRAAEKTAACRTNNNGQTTQPRIMQVIAMSKQQGLLQTHSKSLDESSTGCSTTGSCQGTARYRALTDQDPIGTTGPSSLGSTAGSISGSTGAIVRVEAHPENNRPVIQAPSTDGSGSWRWRSLDHGTGVGGGTGTIGAGGGGGSLRQSFELNDLNRDSESSDSMREGSIDRKRANHIVTTTATVSTPPIVTVHTQNTGQSEQRLHPQGLSTIRVTPGDGSGSGSGGGGGGGGGGGLFDDEDEDDDFFGSKSLKKSDSAGQEKSKPKKAILFDEDDEDGDIFSEKYKASTPAQSKKEVLEEQAKQPEKKMLAGAISMFGPGTKNLLSEGLKKHLPSTSEESEKSEENGPAPDAGKVTVKQTQKPQTRGLFSDDEDTQGSPTIPKSQSKPEPTSQSKVSKAPLSLFDDEEEEDLFASAAKSKPKPTQTKASPMQPSKTLSSSLFSDDEDQWLSPKSSAGKPETGGMKPSASAPSSLPSAKTSHKSSLFDDDDDDDLFAPAKESSQKKPQRVALLFEDEDDDGEDKGSLFGTKPVVRANTAAQAAAKTPVLATQSSSQLEKTEEVLISRTSAEDKPSEQEKPAAKTPEPLSSPPSESSESKKKPAGAVSLFGGIDILAGKQKKSPLEDADSDDSFLSKDSPPPDVEKEKTEEKKEAVIKVKKSTVSLFDDEDDESEWNEPIFTPSKPSAKNTQKPAEERSQTKSTGVFQDEELLFSQTQQKDNDPDVDLFATSGKAENSKLSSMKPAAQSLFADDDEDDLFSSTKPKAPPPKTAEKPSKPFAPLASPDSVSEIQKPAPTPIKVKDSSSRIGKLQANLMINPAALLPGAAPSLPGAISVLPGMAPSSSSGVSSSSLSPSPAATPEGAQADREGGVSFDTPVQVTTLQCAHKGRDKGPTQRRPQSRAARQQAARSSAVDKEETPTGDVPVAKPSPSGLVSPPPDKFSQTHASPSLPNSAAPTVLPTSSPSQSSLPETSPRPSALTLPVSTKDEKKDSSATKVLPSPDEDDLFGSDSLFGGSSVTNTPSIRQTTKTAQPQASSNVGLKKDKDKSTLPSIFDDNTDDLFQKVKPRSTTKKAKTSPFLEEDDDEEDIFGLSNSSTPTSTSSKDMKNSSSFSKQDIFQDEVTTVPKVHKKHKEKTIDASLFDDNIDIFADLTDTLKPKQKSKTKGETKSIFDDDMDDIFSPSTVKPVTKAPQKTKKTPPSQESSTAADSSNIFDDPLNALGGK